MSDTNTNNTKGIGFCGLLTILFIGLKLTENIDWSWWWVLSPIWIPCAFVAIILIGLGVVGFGVVIFKYFLDKRNKKRVNRLKTKV